MYIKFDERENGRRFTFFERTRIIDGVETHSTEKSVFGCLSEGIKTGENNGKPIYENDYWNVTFCGKAYEMAKTLKNFDKICVVEMNIRNVYSKNTRKSYPQIMVTDFDFISSGGNSDEFVDVPVEDVDGLPFE